MITRESCLHGSSSLAHVQPGLNLDINLPRSNFPGWWGRPRGPGHRLLEAWGCSCGCL